MKVENNPELSLSRKQFVVSTLGRTFYDFFMESLSYYNGSLVIDYGSLSEDNNTKYNYSIFKTNEKSESKIKTDAKLIPIDAPCLRYGLIIESSKCVGEHTALNLNIKKSEKVKLNIEYSNYMVLHKRKSSLTVLDTDSKKIFGNWQKYFKSQKQLEYAKTLEVALHTNTIPVSFKPYPSLGVMSEDLLKTHVFDDSSKNKEKMTIVSMLLSIERTIAGEREKNKHLNTMLEYEDDEEEKKKWDAIPVESGFEPYSKIALKMTLANGLDSTALYPRFTPFQKFSSEAMIIIGENVPDEKKKSYAFFQGESTNQSAYLAQGQDEEKEGFSLATDTDGCSTYWLQLPACLGEEGAAVKFYAKAAILNMGSNSFNPLVNEDLVQISFHDSENGVITAVKTPTIFSEKEGTKEQIQAIAWGQTQECTLRVESTQSDKVMTLDQNLKTEKEQHTLVFSKEKGILISFSKDS